MSVLQFHSMRFQICAGTPLRFFFARAEEQRFMTLKVTDKLTPHPEHPESHSAFWQNAHAYFDRVYQTMNLDPTWFSALSTPKRVLTVSCPVRMDDGRIQVYTGFRA